MSSTRNPMFAVVFAGIVIFSKVIFVAWLFTTSKFPITALSVPAVKFLTDILHTKRCCPPGDTNDPLKVKLMSTFHLVSVAGATKVLDDATQYPGLS